MTLQIAARRLLATLVMLGLTAGVMTLFEGPHAVQQAYADTAYQQKCQEKVGRRCPQAANCPLPLSSDNYYCALDPEPSTCGGMSPTTDCVSPSFPVRKDGDPPVCGYRMDCLLLIPIIGENGRVECTDTPDKCLEVQHKDDDTGVGL